MVNSIYMPEALRLAETWQHHMEAEFELKDADAALETMTDNPELIHVPICAGAVGREPLRHFYANVFIPQLPDDLELVLLSRTIGPERVVDEFILRFTHSVQMDWFLPGIASTGRALEVPHVAIVSFDGEKIRNEHIYWDQGTVLTQLGLIKSGPLPVCGAATAHRLLDPRVPSNPLMRGDQRVMM